MPVDAKLYEVDINGNTYFINRFPPFQALEILGDLQKQFVGPILSQIDGKETPKDADGNLVLSPDSRKGLMDSISKISNNLDGRTLRLIAERLLDKNCISVALDGDKDNVRKLDAGAQGLAFSGVADIVELCWEVLKHNYAEVITRLSSPTGPARSLLANRSVNSRTN